MQQQPDPKNSSPKDYINAADRVARIVSMPFLPILRTRWGTHGFDDSWPCPVYILFYAGVAEEPVLVYWIPPWLTLVAFRWITSDRREDSTYRGWPWLGGLFSRREGIARFIEAALVLVAGYGLGGPVGNFLMIGAAGLFLTYRVDSMVIQSHRRHLRDAEQRARSMARLQRGEEVW